MHECGVVVLVWLGCIVFSHADVGAILVSRDLSPANGISASVRSDTHSKFDSIPKSNIGFARNNYVALLAGYSFVVVAQCFTSHKTELEPEPS